MKLASQIRSLVILTVPAIAALLLAFPVHLVQAEIIYTGTYFDIQVSAPIDVGTTNTFKAVTLTAVGKNGYCPNAFDYAGSGIVTWENGTTASKLHQIYQHDEDNNKVKTPTLSTEQGCYPLTPTQLALDSHFLVYNDNIAIITTPAENKTSLYPGEDPSYGFIGSYLIGAFSLKELNPSETWDFAYLVVFDGTQVQLNCQIGATLGGGSIYETVSTSFMVPEPGALVLLITGGVGLLVLVWRRRRKS